MAHELKYIPNLILIGSTTRNSGKTTLAELVIKELKSRKNVIALKITSTDGKSGKCIHGDDGCGVCSSFAGDFELSEELSMEGNKDTAKLLAAGSDQVYWLKTLKKEINQGFQFFMEKIPKNSIIICESNSLRKYIKPAIFIMINNSNSAQVKSSALEVMSKADLIVESTDQKNFEEKIDDITSQITTKFFN